MAKLFLGNREVTPTIYIRGNGISREVSPQGVYQMPTQSLSFELPDNATNLGSRALQQAFYGCTGVTSADLSSLTSITNADAMSYAFGYCTSLTSVDLSSLVTLSGRRAIYYAFQGCSGLTTLDLSSLTTISGNDALQGTFIDCTSLTSVDLSSLTTLGADNVMSHAFRGCTSLASVDLSSLSVLSGEFSVLSYAFQNTVLTSLSFPALNSNSFGYTDDHFYKMLNGVTGCTVHFPSNLQSVIGSWSDVTAGFRGT